MEQAYRRTPEGDYVYEKSNLPTLPSNVVVINDAALEALPEYSSTNPTGVYPNKLWRRDGRPKRLPPHDPHYGWPTVDESAPPLWLVCEYVPHPERADLCRIVKRVAASPQMIAAIAEGVLWWMT